MLYKVTADTQLGDESMVVVVLLKESLRSLALLLGAFMLLMPALVVGEGQTATDVQKLEPSPAPSVLLLAEIQQAENVDLKQVVSEPLPTPDADVGSAQTPNEDGAPAADGEAISKDAVSDQMQSAREAVASGTASDSSATTPTPEYSGPAYLPNEEEEARLAAEGKYRPPLVILGTEVLPGTSTRLGWSPNVSFLGIAAPTPVLVVNGVNPGPTLCLTSAIHGDELNGIEIVRHVLYSIDAKELSGTVIGVPIVNLQGFRRSSRYLPDRRDLNRYFPGNNNGSSASRIAYSFFNEVISHCDLLVDLHTGSFHRTNLPQLRANLAVEEVADLTKMMGSIVVVHSSGAKGCLRRAAVEAGIPAVTLEAGQPHQLQKTAVNHGIKSVETLLDTLKMLKRRAFWELKSEPVYYQSHWVRAREGGVLLSEVELGDKVRLGDLLGVVSDPITNMRSEIRAPYNGRIIGMALNQVIFPGFAAYHIGLQSSAEAAAETPPDEGDDSILTPSNGLESIPDPDPSDERLYEDS
ncbi:succinylglutamate desuccinylase/aspartoacylase family protein [Teredinibacter waterburyi]|uniref:succinylglutamate desuccinylase/aspartoacylase family protein n=1 Tax=Teredinibacter waterburyi TaxID=1500538 RepID=UPI001FECA0B7|nr:succinylglutamate desuccinylase/aspartoacylase family protein [Teredinibacter waterburyi]